MWVPRALALLLCRAVDGRVAMRAASRLQPPSTVHPPAAVLDDEPPSAEQAAILRWLRHVLRPPKREQQGARGAIELGSVGSVLPAFSSGVLLCLLVERCAATLRRL